MPVVVDSWGGAVPSTRNQLMAKVARMYGYDLGDPEVAEVVLEALDDSVNELNTNLFEFNKVIETDIPLVAGENTIDLSAPFYRESLAYLVNTTDTNNQAPLNYYPWVQFQRWFGDKAQTGAPSRYSVFNADLDGKLYLHTTPDAATASSTTLTIEYYKRVPLISSVALGKSISVPREIENALVYGAQKRYAIHTMGPGDKDVAALEALETKALDKLRRVDRLHPDERKQWILSDFSNRNKRKAQTDFYVKY